MAVAVAGYVAACAVPTFLGVTLFDRYLLPLVPLIGVLVLGRGAREPGAAARSALRRSGRARRARDARVRLRGEQRVVRRDEVAGRGGRGPRRRRARGGSTVASSGRTSRPRRPCGARRVSPPAGVCIVVDVASDEPRGRNVLRVEPVWGPGGPPNWIVAAAPPVLTQRLELCDPQLAIVGCSSRGYSSVG